MEQNELPQDFKEFFKLLNSESVDYLLVGGFAVGIHGYMRFTADIDARVKPDEANAKRVANVLMRFGFSASSIPVEKLTHPNCVFQIGVPPVRVDIITSVSGLEFDKAYANRIASTLEEVPVQVLCLADLKTNKRASGRNKDLADLDNLPD